MSVTVLSRADVERLLPMDECIEAMAGALASLARGEVHQPLRSVVRPPDADGFMGLMPVYRGGERPLYALKTVCIFPQNPARHGIDAHQGTVDLFDGETGEVIAIMNASAVTAIRTAAVSAVATRLLAREDARELAILGAGVQARSHLEALRLVRGFERVRVYGRTPEHRELLVSLTKYPGVEVEAAASAEDAVRGADVVVTATNAREPVLRREWLKEGAHVNAVGSSIPSARELDSATVAASSLFVDRRESTVNEAGDYLLALAEGAIPGPGHIRAEIGEVLIGTAPGRRSPGELTVFKSLGLATEDLAAAEHVYRRALAEGVGATVGF